MEYISKQNPEEGENILGEEKQWTKMFGEACGELSSETNPLPHNVFLISDSGYERWFSSMIERVDFSQFTETREAFHVNSLIGEQTEGLCVLEGTATQDSFLSIGSLFYNREYLSRRS